jgi:hypothetical protein
MTAIRWVRYRKTQILPLFSMAGPGIITANVDNDAGGARTCSQAKNEFDISLPQLIPTKGSSYGAVRACADMVTIRAHGE